MRDLRNFEDAARENQMETLSLASVGYLWNEWEIHCLILASLAWQVLLFFTAGLRKRSTSGVLSTVLWLAYLSSDYVAIFVLGHLAVHASGLQHELLLFWAPFLLVHLGGQDTITALSVQDNELWTRHLLGFVSQVAVAGYVVSKSSWPDKQLLAATMLVFLNGSFKYAGRTYCLYSARPANLRVDNLRILSNTLLKLKLAAEQLEGPSNPDSYRGTSRNDALELLGAKFDLMLGKRNEMSSFLTDEDATEIMSADAPLNETESVLVADDLPTLLGKFESTPGPRGPYEYVGGKLAKCYERFYTKRPLLDFCEAGVLIIFMDHRGFIFPNWYYWMSILWLIATLFQYLSTPIALVLFILSEKGHQVHSRTDVIVSYILLVGAIILDVSSASISILSSARSNFFRGRNRINNAILPVANYIQPAWSRKQWAEKLAQYSMVKRYTLEDTVWQRIHKCLAAWGVELWDPSLTHTQVTEDLKGFVLNNLILFGISRQYNFANFRGQLALQKWRQKGPGTIGLYYSINGVKDFPTSVLIWHIATDICYYSGNSSTTSIDSDKFKKKQMSRELSNYILYLVFKCGVMLTSNSQLVYNKVHDEMEKILADQQPQMVNLGEKEAAMKVFEGTKDEHPTSMVNEKQKQSVDTDNATSSHLKKLLNSTAEAIYSPVLPHASKVAQELMGIDEEANRWDLIAAVWSEMLYYTAPRCGGAFHYQHLNTGGEFITHVLLLMRSLGPFLPGHDSSTP